MEEAARTGAFGTWHDKRSSMSTVRQRENPKVEAVDRSIRLLKRLVSAILLVMGLLYWSRIIGISPEPGLRFDTMSIYWQFASVVLAVLLPLASLGLWGLFTWGTTSWLITACTQSSLHTIWPDHYGENLGVVAFHLSAIGLYAALKLLRLFLRRSGTSNAAIQS